MGRSWRWIVEASIDADAIELHDLLARDRAFLKGRPRKIGDRTTEQAVCAMAACDTYRDDTSQADVQEARAAAEVALKQLATCGPWMMARTRAAIVCLLAYWRVNDLIDRSCRWTKAPRSPASWPTRWTRPDRPPLRGRGGSTTGCGSPALD